MKLVLANFNNVLGLNGTFSFLEDKPLLIYGDNVSGKSNIINMLRYCLIPTLRGKRGYAEEKRLKKNEILLKRNTTGSVEIYFLQNSNFYKLYYYFSRKGKNVSQKQKLYESERVELPLEDERRIKILSNLDWKDSGISSSRSLKEKFVDLGIYSEVLDILVSPSNVRNFSEAINGSVVRVPEIIAKRISNIHENSSKYLGYLKKLYGVIILEREELDKNTKELRNDFGEATKKLPEISIDKIFVSGETTKNLEDLNNSLSKKLESIPSTVSEMKETLIILSSEKYGIWTSAIDQLLMVLTKKENITSLIEKKESFENLEDTLTRWKTVFEGLPADSRPEGLLTFPLPDYTKFDFDTFTNPERMKSIFLAVDEAKKSFQRASQTCRKYKLLVETSEINGMIKSYNELLKALKTPLEPKGDPALLSKREDKVVVSIPLDIAIKKIEYLRGIEPTPLIHRPEKLAKEEFEKEISRLQTEIKTIQSDFRTTKKDLSNAKKLLKKAKRLREDIDQEVKVTEKNMETLTDELDGLTKEVSNSYYHHCEVFKLKRDEISLSSKEALDGSFNIITSKYEEAQKIFSQDLIRQMKKYPEILEKFKITEEKDFAGIVKKVRGEFEQRIEEVTKLQEEYKKVNDWILTNTIQLKSIENKRKSITILNDALLVSQSILSKINEKTDINRIIEDLAGKIEYTVKDIYVRIFPEDASFNFSHSGKGQFLTTIDMQPITHPSGSQRAAISVGIMLSLAHTFGLPMILDEAFDRIDIKRLKYFCECITGLADVPSSCQICLAGYTSFNIEKNPEVLPYINSWKKYLVERTEVLDKNIEQIKKLPISE